jgi:hypothetical protein
MLYTGYSVPIFQNHSEVFKLIENYSLLESCLGSGVVLIVKIAILSIGVGYRHTSEDIFVTLVMVSLSLTLIFCTRF